MIISFATAFCQACQVLAPSMNKLNMRQRKFVDAYIQTSSATKSAELAGYSPNKTNLEVRGSLLLKEEKIQKEIEKIYEEIVRKTEEKVANVGLTVQEIKEGIAYLAKNAKSEQVRTKNFELAGRMHALFEDKMVIRKEGEQAYQRLILERFDESGEQRLVAETPVNSAQKDTNNEMI